MAIDTSLSHRRDSSSVVALSGITSEGLTNCVSTFTFKVKTKLELTYCTAIVQHPESLGCYLFWGSSPHTIHVLDCRLCGNYVRPSTVFIVIFITSQKRINLTKKYQSPLIDANPKIREGGISPDKI